MRYKKIKREKKKERRKENFKFDIFNFIQMILELLYVLNVVIQQGVIITTPSTLFLFD